MTVQICNCTHPVCDKLPSATRLALRASEGAHTLVYIGKCDTCKGLVGFPRTNLDAVMADGTPEAMKTLEETVA